MIFKLKTFLLYFFIFSLAVFSSALAYSDIIISGRVVDRTTQQPLVGANLVVENTNYGAITDTRGSFSIQIPHGKYVISASFIGYEIAKKVARPTETDTLSINFQLRPTILPGQEVTITATRAKERATPVAFVDLPRQEISESYWAQDIPALLSEVPGIYAYSDAGNGIGYSYLKIRGFDQKRVAVMINGIPLNDPEDHQVYWVDMPDLLASVHDIQIQRGVGSSIYGASSFGGTVNIQTSELNLPRQINVSTGAGSYRTQKYSFNLHSALIDNQYAFSARFSKILSDCYRDNSAVDKWAYFLSAAKYTLNTSTIINIYGGPELTHASWEASPQSELKKNHRHNPIDYQNSIDNFNQPHYELHHRWRLSENLSWNNTLYYIHGKGYYESFKSNKKLFDFGMQPYYLPDSTLINRTDLVRQKWVEKNQYGVISRMDWDHQKGTLTFGVDGYLFDSDHWGSVVWAAQLPPGVSPNDRYYRYTGDKKMFTFFAHELYQLKPQLSLMADFNIQLKGYNFQQHEQGNFKGVNQHAYNVRYQFVSPRVGLNYNFSPSWNGFINFSMAHREPTDDDLFDVWLGPDDIGAAPLFGSADSVKSTSGEVKYLKWSDPLTKAEKLLDFELGLGYQSQRFKLKLNSYWMDFQNEIVPYSQVDKDGFPIKGNADHTIHRGIEGSFGLQLSKQLQLSGAFAMSQNYFQKFTQYESIYDDDWNFVGSRSVNYSGKAIAGFPDRMANLKLRFESGIFTSHLVLQHIGRQYLDNNEMKERSISPHSLLNFYVSCQLKEIIGLNGIKLSLWVNNLLDVTYETAGYYDSWYGENYLWPGASRNFFIGMETSL
ncbi:MAG TPA: TonB-dependent receptor [bacterium]|nr:TonB-dependent receptor [bacterium]